MPDSDGTPRLGVGSIRLEDSPNPCPYLPDRIAVDEAWAAISVDPAVYRALLDENYRRSGYVIYRPRCPSCSLCRQLRVLVDEFAPSRSQRRCLGRNTDLELEVGPPRLTAEKADLYRRYMRARHPESSQGDDPASLFDFLYAGSVPSLEITSRDRSGQVVCVSLIDPVPDAWSSVYCWFEPEPSRRGLGTWSILTEIEECRRRGLAYYYLGYWVEGAATMAYKGRFRPAEARYEDGWRRLPASSSSRE